MKKIKEKVVKVLGTKMRGGGGAVVTVVALMIVGILLCIQYEEAISEFIDTITAGITSKGKSMLGI